VKPCHVRHVSDKLLCMHFFEFPVYRCVVLYHLHMHVSVSILVHIDVKVSFAKTTEASALIQGIQSEQISPGRYGKWSQSEKA